MVWSQVYDPMGNAVLSTVLAAIPVIVLLGGLAFLRLSAHIAALAGLAAALVIAIFVYGMPAQMAGASAMYGAFFGLLPIGWIVLNIIFLYQLTRDKGYFTILQDSIAGVTEDRRLQLLLIAFAFGAFFEGAAGFGTPVAVTGAILIGLGFSPLAASGLSLIANTAPVAYGALGTPIIALSAVTGLDLFELSAMVGRQLPFFSVLVPFWLVWAFAGWRGMLEVWPAILVTGVSFAIPQFLISNYHGPWLVDVGAAIVSMACLTAFLRIWKPRNVWRTTALKGREADGGVTDNGATARGGGHDRAAVVRAWVPWVVLSVFVFAWGTPQVRGFLNGSYTVTKMEQTATGPVKTEEKVKLPWDGITKLDFKIAGLHEMVEKVPPVVAKAHTEKAVYSLNWLSATGSGILLAAILAGLFMRYSFAELLVKYWHTIKLVRFSLLTIAAMLALGFTTRYSGTDATLGLAFAHTGVLYPFFGTMLGWLGVALTGSDTASNVLFGGLQKITSEQLGLNANLMASANSSGGVMGKMIDAQSIVVASTATRWYGHEGDILRYVFFHSVVLAMLVGGLVMLQAYVYPFTLLQVWPAGG
ncbi:MAG TPA: L-lactate permease [Burkholderiales bacterium]|jgi:lactate permease|nr:L-lactate permease [Burkholderiales bacterium]